MKNLQTFETWGKIHNNELNEIFGIGNLIKSWLKNLSEPVKKKIDVMAQNIDKETGKIIDYKDHINNLISTFKNIAQDKKADLKDVDDIRTVKDIMKEFLTDIRAVFVAARIPFMSMIDESTNLNYYEVLNEDLKLEFSNTMTLASPENFEKSLNAWIDKWIDKHGKNNLKNVEKQATDFIGNMMTAFEKKIRSFSSERLEKLVDLSNSNKEKSPKNEEIIEILKDTTEKEKVGKEKMVKTIDGKKQFISAIQSNLEDLEMFKTINSDGTYDITIKDIEL